MNTEQALGVIGILVWVSMSPAVGSTEMKAAHDFDAAPFGMAVEQDDPRCVAVKWAEPRKIRKVILQFEDVSSMPKPAALRVEYWHRVWNGGPDAVAGEKNAGSVGWDAMDDWTNGSWKRAETHAEVDGHTIAFTFAPTGSSEFPEVGDKGVGYRKTIKLRVVSEETLPKVTMRALTDSQLVPVTARIQWGRPAAEDIEATETHEGVIEVYNGAVTSLGTFPGGRGRIDDAGRYEVSDGRGLDVGLVMAVDALNTRYDDTVVTVRDGSWPFSFRADEVARGERILIDDLGVLVTRGDDRITLAEYREALREFPGRSIYDRVFDEPEQTLAKAWDHMPLKRPLYFVHGLPGNRNSLRQTPEGNIIFETDNRWFKLQPSPRDSARRKWKGRLTIHFGLPAKTVHPRRELTEGYLPELRTWIQDGPIHYEQMTLLDTLDGDLNDIRLDNPTALFAKVRVVNTSEHEMGTARLRFASALDVSEEIHFADGLVTATYDRESVIRFLIDENGKGEIKSEGDHLAYELALPPGESHTLYVTIPSATIGEAEAKVLAGRTYAEVSGRVCAYWRELIGRGAQIHTSEPWLDDFYKAHLAHMLINCFKELESTRLHAHVATFHYGVYPNESAMMISDLDRRGYHEEARRNLDSYFHYQGSVPLPGNYTSGEGVFYGAGGHECCGYNKNHGYICWLMAQHWWMTRDRAWMEEAAPKLIAACEWIMAQRRVTMTTNPDGSRPIEYGVLPAGSLEDVTDYWYWLSTNSATVWGFLDLAEALADFGHPRGEEMRAEAMAFHEDYLRATRESMVRAPVVGLRDGTYVPKIPSRLYERGRSHGWIRETLEGSIFLPAYKVLDPAGPEARWILQDYEDNLYVSDGYGYSIPAFDVFWFDRGGFSMQANLLDGPLPYLYRDEIKHYVRAVLNGFASAFYPETRMCNEHSLPELGYPAGDHFKTSDESQVTYWLRLMFVHENGGDLYLGQAIPRYWLASGKPIGIDRAPSYFGPLSWHMQMAEDRQSVHIRIDPPTRDAPGTVYLRVRHPDTKPMTHVTVNGQEYDAFDADKEWIVLPGTLEKRQDIVVTY